MKQKVEAGGKEEGEEEEEEAEGEEEEEEQQQKPQHRRRRPHSYQRIHAVFPTKSYFEKTIKLICRVIDIND
jgi:hypothetical protein